MLPLIVGCASHLQPAAAPIAGPRLQGRVHGGQQPVAGASLQLYAASTAGDGTAAIPLLSTPATTGAQGQFSLGSYSCPSPAAEMVLVATGGNPGLSSGQTNPALALETALGRCDGLTPTTFVAVNELTTVVAVAALAPFMSAPSGLGSSASDASALTSGFALAAEMANSATGQLGGSTLPAGTTVPVNEIDTLADIVAACVNTAGPAASGQSPCDELFALTTLAGGSAPADTITALLNLFANPAANVSSLRGLAPAASPYQPTLGADPTDFSVGLANTYGATMTPDFLSFPMTTVGELSGAQEIQVVNRGSSTLSVAAAVLAGSAAGDFTSQSNCGQGTLSAGGTCSFLVWFQPQGRGARTASLQLTVSGLTTNIALSGSAIAVSSPLSSPQPMADYNFLDGSGTTVTDQVGGFDGTFATSAAAPSWTSTGLAFDIGQAVALPAALNSAQTFLMAVYLTPLSTPAAYLQAHPYYETLLTSSAGDSGLSLLAAYADEGDAISSYGFSPSTYTGNYVGIGSHATAVIAGFHVLGWVLGTSGTTLDRLFIDGVEVPTYFGQVASGAVQASGEYNFGAASVYPFQQSGLQGTLYRAQFYNQTLTPAQMAAASDAVLTEVASRDVLTTTVPSVQGAPQLHCIGDSITYGFQADFAFCSKLQLTGQSQYNIVNWGIPGVTLPQITGSELNRVAGQCQSTGGRSVALVFAGTNDFAYRRNPASIVGFYMAQEIAELKAAGCTVFAGTMLSRQGTGARNQESLDSDKDAFNDLIRANWASWGADGLTDYGASPSLAADGAYSNQIYFQSDQVHPNDTGQLLLASIASNSMNYFFGSNATQPTTPALATYAMQSGDRFVLLSNLGSAGTVTLPDCTGPTDGVYTINNNQSAVAVQVQGMMSQPINSSAAPVVLPGNAVTTFTVATYPSAQSGCYWKM